MASPSIATPSPLPTPSPDLEEDADDPGIRSFFPPDMKMSASFAALRDAGRLPELFDLVRSRAALRCLQPPSAPDTQHAGAAAGQQ
jgi:hypothetical protein